MEACKRGLTNDPDLQHNIDWLTEVIRRFSDAALAARPFMAVNMKLPTRAEKVSRVELYLKFWPHNLAIYSGRSKKLITLIANGLGMKL